MNRAIFAYTPALEGCVLQGKSREEMIKNISEATELYLASLFQEELVSIVSKLRYDCFICSFIGIAPAKRAILKGFKSLE